MNPMMKQTTEAIAVSNPAMRTVFVRDSCTEAPHLAYDAEVQFIRKPNEVRMVLCSEIDPVREGDTVLLTYHAGLRCYQHARSVSVSSEENCTGGFFYTNGEPA